MQALVSHTPIKPSGAAKSIGPWSGYELLLLLVGISISLLIGGYQFGLSNHTVYLIEPLRENHPQLLQHDWWATSTLQYHGAFSTISAALMRFGIIREVFIIAYFALLILFHIAWWQLNHLLGGDGPTYLFSVILFYFSGAGFGLGLYTFLQDSSVLPSNLANIAMLLGICFYSTGRLGLAGLLLGLSGTFHLNHAIVAPWLWAMMLLVEFIRGNRFHWKWAAGTVAVISLSLFSVLPVIREIPARSYQLPLADFLDLYVRLRHAHHYDPRAWSILFWLGFLWPIPLAFLKFRKISDESAIRLVAVFHFFLCLQIVALALAGFWYVNETFIQLSIYRFSIFAKLLSCIGAAVLLIQFAPTWSRKLALPLLILGLLMGAIVQRGRGILLDMMPQDQMDYVALCNWARDPANTPRDAIFIVPPQEQVFRLYAQRAIVVNLKGVPQLSSELKVWRQRLVDVLDDDPLKFAARFDETLKLIHQRYESLPPQHFTTVAKRYNAPYLILEHEISDPSWQLIHTSGPFRLYHLQ
jgi:hypothetical protein